MKFAIINTYCGYGSTGNNVIKNYKRLIDRGHCVKIFYGIRKQSLGNSDFVFFGSSHIVYTIRYHLDELLGTMGLVCLFPTMRLIKYLKAYKPDVVWLNNLHGDYINEYWLLTYLKKMSIMTVYSMPDEYAFLGKCCSVTECQKFTDENGCRNCPRLRNYPRSLIFDNSHLKFILKKKAYANFENLVFKSAPYVIGNAKKSTLLRGKELFESDASVDTENIFYPRNIENIRKQYSLNNSTLVVLICAPSSEPLKGVKYLIEAAEQCLDEDIIFFNISFDSNTSLCPRNYIPLPYEKDKNKLAEYYSLADVYVCTSLSDAQPNTCLEALACGTPIIGFNVSGVPYIAPNEFGTYVEARNVNQLAQAIKAAKKKTPDSIERCREYARSRFSIEASNERYNSFINIICKRVENETGKI